LSITPPFRHHSILIAEFKASLLWERDMDGTMMDFSLTLTPILERAGKLFPEVKIVTRLPD
jgi:hypothetical protein